MTLFHIVIFNYDISLNNVYELISILNRNFYISKVFKLQNYEIQNSSNSENKHFEFNLAFDYILAIFNNTAAFTRARRLSVLTQAFK